MKSGVRMRLRELAETRPLALLAFVGVVAASAAAAAPLSHPAARAALATAVEQVTSVEPEADAAPVEMRRVWTSIDLDGDGRDDFVNPTGREPRGHDAYGEGEFGARRDAGQRRHEGVDYVSKAGQPVSAPISGYVTKIGYAYEGDQDLKFVEVTNPALRIAARVFYVNPAVEVGQAIAMGRPIGSADSLQRKYPGGMTDHVHLELIDRHGRRINAAKIITAQYRPVTVAPTLVATAD